ncbi:hypothetical protein ELE36_07150 [Pseudolysobacter antarcticus]|uniref:DUF2188 domain-containing protein n=1 Tax=Pseudolysobacter antarcticus TaxID=2511995 RepID=A0A411HI16_9GAMM|nr:hypothetical protein [Pseudolysobacter antarcticus]QBB70158.1 hypothetical protein ELE36_07150 [Pseudolysobacter antarcticus]
MSAIEFHVLFDPNQGRWLMEEDGHALAEFSTQQEAAEMSQTCCLATEETGADVHLIIHAMDGAVASDMIYGYGARR